MKTTLQLANDLLTTSVHDNKVVGSSGGNDGKLAKSDFTKPVRGVEEFSFLTSSARQAFTQLSQVFSKALIFWYFDTDYHIQIETDASGYAIGSFPSQITLEISQWYSVVYYSQRMILAKTHYKTHNAKLLAIVEAFKN